MSYSPEQVEECADGYDALGEPVGASMLRAYAATLRQAARVDEGAVRGLIHLWRQIEQSDEPQTEFDKGYEQASQECAAALEAALSAQPAERQGVTDEIVEHVQYSLDNHEDNRDYAEQVSARSVREALEAVWPKASTYPAAPVGVPDGEVRLWDTQWMNIVNHDNCYRGWDKTDAINHAVKMTEQAIARNVADGKLPPPRLAAAPSAPQGNAGLGIPSCGKPLCSENDHHPLCPSAPQGVECPECNGLGYTVHEGEACRDNRQGCDACSGTGTHHTERK